MRMIIIQGVNENDLCLQTRMILIQGVNENYSHLRTIMILNPKTRQSNNVNFENAVTLVENTPIQAGEL